ncbi:hypothetical protein C9374_002623 [Naegleria lovaniensis]|uniref:ADP/ATP translocase n=1 Tax=Naegleria lovaniensis TaxID=51637 RepID=A0AA88GSF2_NAELO|nr:uncharacterized protein C9374_002623 [Naegleria lovaniensis]KAG2386177.1 hypothetical protein C9374_002623 [Naegleria lovaniensis]
MAQQQSPKQQLNSTSVYTFLIFGRGEIPPYKGIIDCFIRVSREEGILSFWNGNFTNVIRYFPTQAFNFAFKDSIKQLFPKFNPKEEFGKYFLVQMASGAMAGAGSLCIVYPLDYARTRLAADTGKVKTFNGLTDCLVKTAKGPSGFLGLYRGFGVSLAGIIPYRGVYFGLYDSFREMNPYKNDYGMKGVVSKFMVAQATALAAGYASYPFDTVRRRLQMQAEKPRDQWLYEGTTDCFKKIARQEGFHAFFDGAAANAFRTIGSALVLVMYDQMQGFFGVNLGSSGSE